MKQWQEKRFEALKLQYALIDVVGDEIGRKLAKDPVMVFIYGSSLGSIKNKILNGLIGDSIQNILNNPEKIKEELTRKDGNQSLGIILNAIGIDPYLKDNSIRLDLSNDIKLYNIVNNLIKCESQKRFGLRKRGEYGKCFELDIYVPELNKGIEFNGNHYHSIKGLAKGRLNWKKEDLCNYHQIKKDFFKSENIEYIEIWELDWNKNKSQCILKVKNFLGL
jgi:hypothetical protein